MTDLEKLIADKQDKLRGRPRDKFDDFKDWRQRIDWTTSIIVIGLALMIMFALAGIANAAECSSVRKHDGERWAYRIIDSKRCWYIGRPGKSKSTLHWAKQRERLKARDTEIWPKIETTEPTPVQAAPAPPMPPMPPEKARSRSSWSGPSR